MGFFDVDKFWFLFDPIQLSLLSSYSFLVKMHKYDFPGQNPAVRQSSHKSQKSSHKSHRQSQNAAKNEKRHTAHVICLLVFPLFIF